MRTLSPNLDREDGLDTVLEVPIPEEITASYKQISWHNMKSWMTRPLSDKAAAAASVFGSRNAEIQFLLGVVGAPLIPLPIRCDRTVNDNIRGCPIESSMAKYIVQQYIAAAGGEHALNSIDSIYAMGKVKMAASEFVTGDEITGFSSKAVKVKSMRRGGAAAAAEVGGFVLWQKRPDLWSLELMVAGNKISAGSDAKVAWRQTPWQHSHASRGPPRPLRRSLQGLDPRSTANLFSNSICIGEKTINDEDCFVLKLEAEPTTLRARSSANVEIIRHTIWGCFSQRTGLLIHLEDSHLLRIKTAGDDDDGGVYWETTMGSLIQDYRTVDGVNIAHSGRTSVSLFRHGGGDSGSHTRTRMEEVWSIEEVDFNIKGLCNDFFLPPADLKRDDGECGGIPRNGGMPYKMLANCSRVGGGKGGAAKVVAIDEENLEVFEKDGGM